MLPKHNQHLLLLKVRVYQLTYFMLSSFKSYKGIHGYSKLFLANLFIPVSLCKIETERSFYLQAFCRGSQGKDYSSLQFASLGIFQIQHQPTKLTNQCSLFIDPPNKESLFSLLQCFPGSTLDLSQKATPNISQLNFQVITYTH